MRARRWRSPRRLVSAVAPEENAFSTAKSPIAVATVGVRQAIGSTGAVAGQPPTHWYMPIAIVARIAATNLYVGIANNVPDSRAPRRFAIVTSQTNPIDSRTLWLLAAGKADPIAKTLATMETTTVIM